MDSSSGSECRCHFLGGETTLNNKEVYLTCLHCGSEFIHKNDAKKYCPECDIKIKRERNRKSMAKKRAKSKLKFKELPEVVADVEAYNKEHNTKLSYGQYVALEGMGKLL